MTLRRCSRGPQSRSSRSGLFSRTGAAVSLSVAHAGIRGIEQVASFALVSKMLAPLADQLTAQSTLSRGMESHAFPAHTVTIDGDASVNGVVCMARRTVRLLSLKENYALGMIAPFGHHVRGVVLRCAKKEMRGIDARRYVAAMANEQTRRDVSIVQSPRKAVCEFHAAIYAKPAVAASQATGGGPQPARIRLAHPRPESTLKRFRHGRNLAQNESRFHAEVRSADA
jgi:hypothetical protein